MIDLYKMLKTKDLENNEISRVIDYHFISDELRKMKKYSRE